MSASCPVCDKDDTIQKLSAVVSSGQASGTFSGPSVDVARGYTTLSGSTKTELAQKLSPPPEPDKPSGFGWWWLLIVPAFGAPLAALFGCPSCALLTGTGWAIDPNTNAPWILLGLILLLVLWQGSWIVAFLYFLRKDKHKRAREEARYAKEKPAWDAAMEKYNRVYFCFRDDVVFDPDTGQTCRPQSLTEFLYSAVRERAA